MRRVETAVLLYLEVVIDEAGPHHPAQYEAEDAASHDEVDAGPGSDRSPSLLSLLAGREGGAGLFLVSGTPSTDGRVVARHGGAGPVPGPRPSTSCLAV